MQKADARNVLLTWWFGMKRYCVCLCICLCVSHAADSVQNITLPNLKAKTAKNILHNNISLSFNKIPKRVKKKQEGIIANKMAHNVMQDTKEVCATLFLFALKDLQEQALRIGSSKVGNIESYIHGKSQRIKKNFQCESGMLFSNVVLRADIL